jgi:DNA-binding LacI/PurR family transcriptional regulator
VLAEELRAAGAADVRIEDWSYETWAWVIPGAGTRENCAFQLTRRMIAEAAATPLPDVLISQEDTMTRGALTALREAGLQPGRDLRIVAAANTGSPVLEPYAADLTLIEFDPADSVRAALEMLEILMNGGTPPVNPVLTGPRPAARVSSP